MPTSATSDGSSTRATAASTQRQEPLEDRHRDEQAAAVEDVGEQAAARPRALGACDDVAVALLVEDVEHAEDLLAPALAGEAEALGGQDGGVGLQLVLDGAGPGLHRPDVEHDGCATSCSFRARPGPLGPAQPPRFRSAGGWTRSRRPGSSGGPMPCRPTYRP